MGALDAGKLNSGLSRIVSVKSYPKTRRQYLSRQTKGRVFRLGVLHSKALTANALERNRRGYVNGQLNTAAIAPSLYHWLFHRCGIPFAETKELVRLGRLKVDDIVVTKEKDLESQLDWSTLQGLDIQVRSSLPALIAQLNARDSATKGRTATTASDEQNAALEAAGEGPWVPALKRAMHRSYSVFCAHPGISLSSEEANPKSFVHRLVSGGRCLSPGAPEATLGLNVLRPIGFMDGIRGLAVASNDVAIIRYWNNEFLGNYGVYDVRFPPGVPSEVVRRACEDTQRALKSGIAQQLSPAVKVPCSCAVEMCPPRGSDVVLHTMPKDTVLFSQRLVITTPLLPYRIVQRIRRAGGILTLVRSGPFVLNAALARERNSFRPLGPSELAVLFTFERKLKTNRMLLSLSEFTEDSEAPDTSTAEN